MKPISFCQHHERLDLVLREQIWKVCELDWKFCRPDTHVSANQGSRIKMTALLGQLQSYESFEPWSSLLVVVVVVAARASPSCHFQQQSEWIQCTIRERFSINCERVFGPTHTLTFVSSIGRGTMFIVLRLCNTTTTMRKRSPGS